MKAPVYGIGILKGGMGKSTTVAMLARLLPLYGARTLVIDLGQPGTTTRALRDRYSDAHTPGEHFAQLLLVLDPLKPGQLRQEGAAEALATMPELPMDLGDGLWLLPYHELLSLAGGRMRSDTTLADLLEALPGSYDIVLIDYPTDLGMLMVASLVATTRVILPLAPHSEAVTGAEEMLALLGRARGAGKNVALGGVLLTQVEVAVARFGATVQAIAGQPQVAGERLGSRLLPFAIKYSEMYDRAYRVGGPVWARTRDASVWAGYVLLAEWLLADAGLGHLRTNRRGPALLPPDTLIIDTMLLRPIPVSMLLSRLTLAAGA
jgi:cellulose biosynthesis protein BcsQ